MSRFVFITMMFWSVGCGARVMKDLGTGWRSARESELRAGVRALEQQYSAAGLRVLWAGAYNDATYFVERNPEGEPLRESILIRYAYTAPQLNGRCFMNYATTENNYIVRLSREHMGGGGYGEPKIIGMAPLNADGQPILSTAGLSDVGEIDCAAVAKAGGGIQFNAVDAPLSTHQTTAADDETDEMASLSPQLPASCIEYAGLLCTNAKTKAECRTIVSQMNQEGTQPKAAKACKAGVEKLRKAESAVLHHR